MTEFKFYRSDWSFEQEVRRHSRYFLSDETQHFLQALKDSWGKRVFTFTTNKGLWRAQIGHDTKPLHSKDQSTRISAC